jgi:hypothetical protein
LLEAWKGGIYELFSSIDLYTSTASEICSKGSVVGRHRNRLIHGLWRPSENYLDQFEVTSGLDGRRKLERFRVDVEYLKAVHTDITTPTDTTRSFITSRILHSSWDF